MSKIGIFDSGFGGLTVLREIVSLLPQYDYIYLGDNARAPYGPKSQKAIFEYTKQAIDYLFSRDCDLVILACNTASAEALRKIQQDYLPVNYPEKRVLGVIIPVAEEVAIDKMSQNVGVIATEGTVKSKTYIKEINKLNKNIKVFQNEAPLLVPLIEAGETSGLDIEKHIRKYLRPLLEQKIDSLILGCTHYALIESEIGKMVPADVRVYNQSKIVADKLSVYLKSHPEIEEKISKKGQVSYCSTDCDKKFSNFGAKIMGTKILAEKVKIDS